MIQHTDLIFAPALLPLIGAAAAFCAKSLRGKTSRYLEIAAGCTGLVLPFFALFLLYKSTLYGAVYKGVIGNWYNDVGISYRFDGISWLINFLGFIIALPAWIYAQSEKDTKTFTPLFLIQTAAVGAMAMCADIFNLFVCLEIMGIASYILVASSAKPGAFLASFSYLMISASAMVFFLFGVYGFYRLTGSLSYDSIALGLSLLPDNGGHAAVISLALITGAVVIRVAVMPLYGWLPDAHALAPHAVSAVLSGVLIKTPLFALSRVVDILPSGRAAGELMGYAGAVTAFLAAVISLSQSDVKRLLAYSSISHIGYIVCAWGAAVHAGTHTPEGRILMSAAFGHAVFHAAFKGLLFLSVGITADRTGNRDITALRGAVKFLYRNGEKIPVTFPAFCIGFFSICALPPFNGFLSKSSISLLLAGNWQNVFLIAAGVVTIAAFIRLARIYFPDKNVPSPTYTPLASSTSGSVYISQIFLSLICLCSGLFGPFLLHTFSRILSGGLREWPFSARSFYTIPGIIKIIFYSAAGFGLYTLSNTHSVNRVLYLIKERPRSFDGLFTAFGLGLAATAAWMLFR